MADEAPEQSEKLDSSWADAQKRTFTNWANAQFTSAGAPERICDITKDLHDGRALLALVKVLGAKRATGGAVASNLAPERQNTLRIHFVSNVGKALRYVESCSGEPLPNIGPEDIVDGNPKLILGLLWQLILRFQLANLASFAASNDFDLLDSSLNSPTSVPASPVPSLARSLLLADASPTEVVTPKAAENSVALVSPNAAAAAESTPAAAASDAETPKATERHRSAPSRRAKKTATSTLKEAQKSVLALVERQLRGRKAAYGAIFGAESAPTPTNLTTAWSDGRIFCCLVNSYTPDSLPLENVSAQPATDSDKLHNLELAFDVARDHLGVPRLLDPNDVLRFPDDKSILTYLSSFVQLTPAVFPAEESDAAAKASPILLMPPVVKSTDHDNDDVLKTARISEPEIDGIAEKNVQVKYKGLPRSEMPSKKEDTVTLANDEPAADDVSAAISSSDDSFEKIAATDLEVQVAVADPPLEEVTPIDVKAQNVANDELIAALDAQVTANDKPLALVVPIEVDAQKAANCESLEEVSDSKTANDERLPALVASETVTEEETRAVSVPIDIGAQNAANVEPLVDVEAESTANIESLVEANAIEAQEAANDEQPAADTLEEADVVETANDEPRVDVDAPNVASDELCEETENPATATELLVEVDELHAQADSVGEAGRVEASIDESSLRAQSDATDSESCSLVKVAHGEDDEEARKPRCSLPGERSISPFELVDVEHADAVATKYTSGQFVAAPDDPSDVVIRPRGAESALAVRAGAVDASVDGDDDEHPIFKLRKRTRALRHEVGLLNLRHSDFVVLDEHKVANLAAGEERARLREAWDARDACVDASCADDIEGAFADVGENVAAVNAMLDSLWRGERARRHCVSCAWIILAVAVLLVGAKRFTTNSLHVVDGGDL